MERRSQNQKIPVAKTGFDTAEDEPSKECYKGLTITSSEERSNTTGEMVRRKLWSELCRPFAACGRSHENLRIIMFQNAVFALQRERMHSSSAI